MGRAPVLKITRWVLIGSENSLLYSILCALSRKGILNASCFVLILLGHGSITFLSRRSVRTACGDITVRRNRTLEKRHVGHLALHRSFSFGKRTTQYSRCDPDVIRSLPIRSLVGKPATKHPGVRYEIGLIPARKVRNRISTQTVYCALPGSGRLCRV